MARVEYNDKVQVFYLPPIKENHRMIKTFKRFAIKIAWLVLDRWWPDRIWRTYAHAHSSARREDFIVVMESSTWPQARRDITLLRARFPRAHIRSELYYDHAPLERIEA